MYAPDEITFRFVLHKNPCHHPHLRPLIHCRIPPLPPSTEPPGTPRRLPPASSAEAKEGVMRRGGSSRRPGPGMGQGVGERDGQEVAGGGLDRHEGELAGALAAGQPSPQVLPLLGEALGRHEEIDSTTSNV